MLDPAVLDAALDPVGTKGSTPLPPVGAAQKSRPSRIVAISDFNMGAMENAGCVTFHEMYVFRSKVTDALVERIASALLPLGSDAAPTPVRSARTQARPTTDAPVQPTPAAAPSRSSPNPLRIGDADRDPLAASGLPPFPSGGSAMPPLASQGDGMVVGPSHPLFQERTRDRSEELGPWGGDGFLPPGAVPPGARFDPVGPFADSAPRFPRGGPRGPSGNPDWDDLPPPGGGPGSMYL